MLNKCWLQHYFVVPPFPRWNRCTVQSEDRRTTISFITIFTTASWFPRTNYSSSPAVLIKLLQLWSAGGVLFGSLSSLNWKQAQMKLSDQWRVNDGDSCIRNHDSTLADLLMDVNIGIRRDASAHISSSVMMLLPWWRITLSLTPRWTFLICFMMCHSNKHQHSFIYTFIWRWKLKFCWEQVLFQILI